METVYSLSGEMPPVEGRSEEDPESSLKAGALVRGSIRQVCAVRRISAGGAVLHLDLPVEPGERLGLDLMSGQKLEGIVVARQGSEVGIRFDEPIDVFAIIARDIVSQPGERRRMPRVELACPALLETVSSSGLVTTRDVSQGGAKIATPIRLKPDEPVMITMEGFRPIEAIVRWAEDGVAGLAFEPELPWQELMPWLKARRDAMPAAESEYSRRSGAAMPVLPAPAPAAADPNGPADGSVQLNLPARVREGTRRWSIEVASITTRSVAFDSFAALRLGTLLWIVLPGLEGWPARIVAVDGYRYSCEFTQPLHPAVLERILALAAAAPR